MVQGRQPAEVLDYQCYRVKGTISKLKYQSLGGKAVKLLFLIFGINFDGPRRCASLAWING